MKDMLNSLRKVESEENLMYALGHLEPKECR